MSKRVFDCSNCGLQIDRDLNASINLEMAVSSTVTACGVVRQRAVLGSHCGLVGLPLRANGVGFPHERLPLAQPLRRRYPEGDNADVTTLKQEVFVSDY